MRTNKAKHETNNKIINRITSKNINKCKSRGQRTSNETNKDSLSVYYANCRSVINKIYYLKALISYDNPDILCLTETWVDTTSKHLLAEINIPGYNLYKYDRTEKKGGGVAIYIRDTITCHLRSDISTNPTNESVWIEITGEGDNVLLGTVYRAPDLSKESGNYLWQEINKASSNNRMCVVGDLNFPHINWNNLTGNSEAEDFLEAVLDNFLEQHVTSPTRGNNILDLVLSNRENMIEI